MRIRRQPRFSCTLCAARHILGETRERAGRSMRGRGWGRGGRYGRKRRLRRVFLLLIPLLLALLVLAELRLSPLIEESAARRAHSAALTVITQAVEQQMADYSQACDYQQLMHIERDDQGRITLLVPDTMLLNRLITDVVEGINQGLESGSRQQLSLPLGAMTGSRLFSSLGPELHFRFRAQGTPSVSIEDDFSSAGINQVRHRIYLRVDSDIRVMVPFARSGDTVSATVLLAEGIIVGYTPDTYVELGF